MKYTFNSHFFDEIDTEEKAYWIGFIWCDGYVSKRDRGNTTEYSLKLSLSDVEHLHKLNECLESNYPIKQYKYGKGAFNAKSMENRLYICNKHFASTLYNVYDVVPNRFDASKLISSVPKKLYRHLVRGILDSDGSVMHYISKDYTSKTGSKYKVMIDFTTYEHIVLFIRELFIELNLSNFKQKITKRHDDGDQFCRRLSYSGLIQVPKILNYLYGDCNIYLERKYKIYKEIIESGGVIK